jgi:D-aminopeptidase
MTPRNPVPPFPAPFRVAALLATALALAATAPADAATRARDLGIPFDGTPGPLNAVTDVAGVTVGHATVIRDLGRGRAARTGVTALFPAGSGSDLPAPAAAFALNGNGEMTGTLWVAESGLLEGPVVLTNTHSVGVARDTVIAWGQERFPGTARYSLPVVAETWDGFLNAINAFAVRPADVRAALDGARAGPVAEGNVGGGTGMVCYGFKGGIGTASRRLGPDAGGYTVGALVQANYGRRPQLVIAGVPVGREIPDLLPERGPGPEAQAPKPPHGRTGSIVAVVATDAPLLPHQLARLARRVPLALGRLGSVSTDSSGDLFLAFSTARPEGGSDSAEDALERWRAVPNGDLDPLFTATVQAVEEAVVNALVAAETMTGDRGHTVHALPHDRLREVLKRYGR